MRGINRGFSIIELMVVMLLLALMATIAIPNLQRLAPSYQRARFVDRCNTLLAIAWQHALTSQRVHRLYFDLKTHTMRVEMETNAMKGNQPIFEPIHRMYENTQYQWPVTLEIKQFYIEGQEQMQRPGIKTEAIWFYIVPDGLAQDAIINMIDTNDKDEQGNPVAFGLVINPFNAHLTFYEAFQKP